MLKVYPYTLPTIDFIAGDSQEYAFRFFYHSNKQPFNLVGCTGDFSIISYVNKTGEPVVSKELEIAGGVSEGIDNVMSVKLEPDDTVNLHGKYIYQITLKDSEGYVEIPKQGVMFIANNINKKYIG